MQNLKTENNEALKEEKEKQQESENKFKAREKVLENDTSMKENELRQLQEKFTGGKNAEREVFLWKIRTKGSGN